MDISIFCVVCLGCLALDVKKRNKCYFDIDEWIMFYVHSFFQIEVVNHQNTQMIDSFTIINRNLAMMVENLRTAEEHREKQKKVSAD